MKEDDRQRAIRIRLARLESRPADPLPTGFAELDAAAGGAIRFTLRAGARDVATGVLSAPPAARDGAQP